MGLPEINFSFHKKAQSFISRSSRGMCLLILDDSTREQAVTTYTRYSQIAQADWSAKSMEYLRMAFAGNPGSVVAVRLVKEGEEMTVKLPETLASIKYINFDYLAYPQCKTADVEVIRDWIDGRRKLLFKKGKAVLPGAGSADSMAVIDFEQENISVLWEDEETVKEYTPAEYSCRIAGVCAGIPLTASVTYQVLDEIVDIKLYDKESEAIDAGRLIIIFDGEKYKIGRGVNTLKTITETTPKDFRKIKLVEAADLLMTDILTTWNDEYVGKFNNSYDNKQMFIGAINQYLKDLENTVVNAEEDHYVEIDIEKNARYLEDQGRDTSEMEEQEIREADTGSQLFLTGRVKLLDAMEDLSLEMML